MNTFDGPDSPDSADFSDDPADQWILDPVSGEYRMRLPGERPPPAAPAPAAEPDRLPAPRPAVGAELELRSTRTEVAPHPGSRVAARAAAGSRAGSRAGGRAASRRAGRRRGAAGGGLWLVGVLGVVGLLGCGTGGYLLLRGGGGGGDHQDCSAAPAAATASPTASPRQTGPTLGPGPSAPAAVVRVTVYDGTGEFGEAETVLSWMQNSELYGRSTNGGKTKVTATTSLVYAPDKAEQARTLAAAMHLPPSALHGDGKGSGYYQPMILTLGKDFVAPGKPLADPSPTVPATGVDHSACSR